MRRDAARLLLGAQSDTEPRDRLAEYMTANDLGPHRASAPCDKLATGHHRTARDHVRGRRITRGDLAVAMLELLDDPIAVRVTLGVAD